MADEFNKELCMQEHGHLRGEMTRIKEDVDGIRKLVEKVRDRLPVWATFLLMALTAALGWSLK